MNGKSDLFVLGDREGFSPRLGTLVSQLNVSREYLYVISRDLTIDALDAKPLGGKNTIGMLLAHLNAAENMFQRITFEDRRFDDEEQAQYGGPFGFELSTKNTERELESYFADLIRTRNHTLAELKKRGDDFLEIEKSFFGKPANVHYYWFHYLLDETRHAGQIVLLRKHLIASANADFEPYSF